MPRGKIPAMTAPALFVQSCYSLLEGVLTPQQLAETAVQRGYQTLILCDHGYLIGAVEFTQACQRQNLKSLLALELDIDFGDQAAQTTADSRIVLVASNEAGWANLCGLSSKLQTSQQPVSLPDLTRHQQGLICLSGVPESWLTKLMQNNKFDLALHQVNQLNEIFPGRFYLQSTRFIKRQPVVEAALTQLSQQTGFPLCAAPWGAFSHADQAEIQRTLLAIGHNTRLGLVSGLPGFRPSALIEPAEEVAGRYLNAPQAMANLESLTGRISFELPLGKPRMPRFPLPANLTPAAALRQQAEQGAQKLYGSCSPEIQQRLDHELEIISTMGFEPIFLIMQEALQYARQKGIPFSSRGSAASSLVAHCLGITSPDPLALGLYFERFLNPARTTPPDIDTDIDSNRRDELIQHMFEQYGRENVSMVGTINRFRSKSAVGDTAKACGLTPADARRLTQDLPHSFFAARFQDSDPQKIFAPLRQKYPQANYQDVFARAEAILGLPRHLSVHPGGIVISPHPTTDLTPVAFSDTKNVTITQFDLDSLEALGLVKLDLLGIRGLSVVSSVADSIYSWSRKDYKNASEVVEAISLNDEATSQIIFEGKTIGCFQIESPGMRSTLKQIQARNVDDILAALALYRPGPMRGGLRDAFIARHNQTESVEHIHPTLSGILGETYGVILYQEQVLRIAHQIGGLSLAESDLLRRAMSHFDPGKQMQQLKARFIQGAAEVSQIDSQTAEKIWEMMAAFAGYGFPKAHAASYAQIAWRSAWCKAHFPAEFLAAVLANWGGYYSQRVYLMEARRMGLTVKPPHINHSQREFCVSYSADAPKLYMGLGQVRGLTQRTLKNILLNRPYSSLEDFLDRADPRYEEAVNLVRCGALDGLVESNRMLPAFSRRKKVTNQPTLFSMAQEAGPPEFETRSREADQLYILGVSVDSHPLEKYLQKMARYHVLSSAEAIAQTGKTIRVAGMRQTLHRSRTSNGQMMAFLTIEDMEGMLDVVLFNDIYRRIPAQVLSSAGPFIIEGVIEPDENGQDLVLRAQKLALLSET